MCNNFKKEYGFTMIEMVISIFILAVGVLGVFSALSVITVLTSNSTDRLTATYLAQEGMEITRNIRDTNWLKMDAGVPATTWVNDLTLETGGQADYSSTSMAPYAGQHLYLQANNFYGYSSVGDTKISKFQRKIMITRIHDIDGKDDHIVLVAVYVSWDERGTILKPSGLPANADNCSGSNCIIAEETLYNWYNYVQQ